MALWHHPDVLAIIGCTLPFPSFGYNGNYPSNALQYRFITMDHILMDDEPFMMMAVTDHANAEQRFSCSRLSMIRCTISPLSNHLWLTRSFTTSLVMKSTLCLPYSWAQPTEIA
jgi:hypothetical protein